MSLLKDSVSMTQIMRLINITASIASICRHLLPHFLLGDHIILLHLNTTTHGGPVISVRNGVHQWERVFRNHRFCHNHRHHWHWRIWIDRDIIIIHICICYWCGGSGIGDIIATTILQRQNWIWGGYVTVITIINWYWLLIFRLRIRPRIFFAPALEIDSYLDLFDISISIFVAQLYFEPASYFFTFIVTNFGFDLDFPCAVVLV